MKMDKSKRKQVTMQDIAQAVGVSKNAVSLALSNKPGVSDDMRSQILKTAQLLGYRIPAQKKEKKECIVVVIPEYLRDDGAFYSDVFWCIEHETRKRGYITITAGLSKEMEEKLVLPNEVDNLTVLGYLAIGVIRPDYLRLLHGTGKQVVCVDIHNNAVPLTSVSADNMCGGYLATEHLIQKGHRRIGFAGPVFTAQSVFERWCGYLQAMLRHGLTIPQESCILGRRDGFELLDSISILGGYLDQVAQMPSAWFCAGDMIAISMLRLLSAKGLQVPQDISIISFDDLKVAEMVSPALTTIHVDRTQMSKQSVHQLLYQALSQTPVQPMHISLPCYLVERQSVAAWKE